ncbi:MAG: DUF420 domain-containing protein [Alphaproteobacteria bacterium]|nr:DUF420 domain-containing protein [Rhodospirillales bacterium]MCW9044888.1 DUF420 domain-containing protein [Alphaproteobacteria bacterium]
MIDVTPLPHLNAGLNATAAVLLTFGVFQIKRGNKRLHQIAMFSASVVSALFLASYLTYHYNAPIFLFNGEGGIRIFYYTVLITHVILATVNAPMILWTLWRAFKGDFEKHKKIARLTAPLWFYVSVSGIVVYLMLYQFNPAAA